MKWGFTAAINSIVSSEKKDDWMKSFSQKSPFNSLVQGNTGKQQYRQMSKNQHMQMSTTTVWIHLVYLSIDR